MRDNLGPYHYGCAKEQGDLDDILNDDTDEESDYDFDDN